MKNKDLTERNENVLDVETKSTSVEQIARYHAENDQISATFPTNPVVKGKQSVNWKLPCPGAECNRVCTTVRVKCKAENQLGKQGTKTERLTHVLRSWPSSGPAVWTGSHRPKCSWLGRRERTRPLREEEVSPKDRAPPRPSDLVGRRAENAKSNHVLRTPSAAMRALGEEQRPDRRRAGTEGPRRSPTDSARLSPSPCTRYGGSSRSREGGNDRCFARKCAKYDPSWSRSNRSAIISDGWLMESFLFEGHS